MGNSSSSTAGHEEYQAVMEKPATTLAYPTANSAFGGPAVFPSLAVDNVRRLGKATPKPPAGSLLISSVAPKSPAAELHLQIGDVLVSVDGAPAASWAPDEFKSLKDPGACTEFIVHRQEDQQVISITLTTSFLGAATTMLPVDIAKRYLKGDEQFGATDAADSCFWLWKAQRWNDLNAVCRTCLQKAGKDSALYVYQIALVAERDGNPELAADLAQEFLSKHAAGYTAQYTTICTYYALPKCTNDTERRKKVKKLWEKCSSTAIRDLYVATFGKQPTFESATTCSAMGKTFPLPYHCLTALLTSGPQSDEASTNRRGSCDFAAAVSALQPQQLLTVCMLGSYRANGPYHDFLQRYRRLVNDFPDVFVNLHVITVKDINDVLTHSWKHVEEELQENSPSVRFSVLLDPPNWVKDSAQARGYPSVFFVNHKATILAVDAHATDNKVWELVSGTSAAACAESAAKAAAINEAKLQRRASISPTPPIVTDSITEERS